MIDPEEVKLAIRRKQPTTTYEIRSVPLQTITERRRAVQRQVSLSYGSTLIIFVLSYFGLQVAQAVICPFFVLASCKLFRPTKDNSIRTTLVMLMLFAVSLALLYFGAKPFDLGGIFSIQSRGCLIGGRTKSGGRRRDGSLRRLQGQRRSSGPMTAHTLSLHPYYELRLTAGRPRSDRHHKLPP